MANDNDFKEGSPWGAPPGGKNGSGRGGPRPPNIDEVIEKIQKLIKINSWWKIRWKQTGYFWTYFIDCCLGFQRVI